MSRMACIARHTTLPGSTETDPTLSFRSGSMNGKSRQRESEIRGGGNPFHDVVAGQPVHTGHRGNRFDQVLTVTHENWPNEVVNAEGVSRISRRDQSVRRLRRMRVTESWALPEPSQMSGSFVRPNGF